MNIVFAGTPDFAVPTLQALARAHNVRAVYTQPDRPAGRGRKLTPSPVKTFALQAGLTVAQPQRLSGEETALRQLQPDFMIVVAYGLILPESILAIPRYGCINVHASLLPRWRGAAPIQRALAAGDALTGISIMQMARGLDTGPVFAQATLPIEADDTAASLHDKLAQLGAHLLVACLPQIAAGTLTARPQHDADATYAHKLTKDEGRIDWRDSATTLARKVRAFNPWPFAHTEWDGQALRIRRARALAGTTAAAAGTVISVDGEIAVATGEGILSIQELQLEGGKPIEAGAFLRGRALAIGARLT